jgi:hypothetical protein
VVKLFRRRFNWGRMILFRGSEVYHYSCHRCTNKTDFSII